MREEEGTDRTATWLIGDVLGRGTVATPAARPRERVGRQVPAVIMTAVVDADGMEALVYALLTSRVLVIEERQLLAVEHGVDVVVLRRYEELLEWVDPLSTAERLALLGMGGPTMAQWDATRQVRVRRIMTALVHADDEVDLFEMAVVRSVERAMGRVPAGPVRTRVDDVAGACALLFSSLAYWGMRDPRAQQEAILAAWDVLLPGGRKLACQPEECTVVAVEQALIVLADASLELRERILAAAAVCVASDGRVTRREAEMIHAVAEALDCPVPPLP